MGAEMYPFVNRLKVAYRRALRGCKNRVLYHQRKNPRAKPKRAKRGVANGDTNSQETPEGEANLREAIVGDNSRGATDGNANPQGATDSGANSQPIPQAASSDETEETPDMDDEDEEQGPGEIDFERLFEEPSSTIL